MSNREDTRVVTPTLSACACTHAVLTSGSYLSGALKRKARITFHLEHEEL